MHITERYVNKVKLPSEVIFRPRVPEYQMDYWSVGYLPTYTYIMVKDSEQLFDYEFLAGFIEAAKNKEENFRGYPLVCGAITPKDCKCKEL